jgi:arylsulfatase A-like enzyme
MTDRRPGGLALAAWFALAAGLLESALTYVPVVDTFLRHQNAWMGLDRVWMPAVANLVWFLAPMSLILLVGRLLPDGMRRALTLGFPAFMGVWSLLVIYTRLHRGAAALLAVGIAVQFVRLMASRTEGLDRLVRRTLPVLVVLVLGLIGWRTIGAGLMERRAIAALPQASGRPNVLLIILDTVRGFSLSLYGHPRPTTPRLQEWARGGVVFERAIAPSPWTLPSHAAMFTGRHPSELSADFRNPLDDTYPTLAEVLRGAGYATGGFAGNLLYTHSATGLNRGFQRYEDFPRSAAQLTQHSAIGRLLVQRVRNPFQQWRGNFEWFGRKRADEVTGGFLDWQAGLPPDRPFFAFLNYFEAHYPYLPPDPWYSQFADTSLPKYNPLLVGHPLAPKPTPEMILSSELAYDAAIAQLDAEIASLIDTLRARGQAERTMIIITSDHGEQFGEHGLLQHGNSMYRQLLQVPLVIVLPGTTPAETRISAPVTLTDLPATILDLAGVAPEHALPGRSLRATWDSSLAAEPPTRIYSEIRRPSRWIQSLVADGRHFIRNSKGEAELFDFDADPQEERELSGSSGVEEEIARLIALADSIAPTLLQNFKPQADNEVTMP